MFFLKIQGSSSFLKKPEPFRWFSFESSNLVFPLRVELLSLANGRLFFFLPPVDGTLIVKFLSELWK